MSRMPYSKQITVMGGALSAIFSTAVASAAAAQLQRRRPTPTYATVRQDNRMRFVC